MKIHIIKSPEVDEDLSTRVLSLLQSVPGAIEFIDEIKVARWEAMVCESRRLEHFDWDKKYKVPLSVGTGNFKPPREAVHWQDMFSKCQQYRDLMHIENDEMIVLLTALTNHRNWFGALDPNMTSNGFVHTRDWEHYIEAPAEFPIAYEIISMILQKHLYGNLEEYKHLIHQIPKGCINDFCQEKRDIMLKLRTADICRECMEVLQKHYPIQIIDHGLSLMEALRIKMLFAQNFRQNSPLSRLIIDRTYRLILPEFGQMEIHLRPLEKALYILFLRRSDGIFISNLCDHRTELTDIYMHLCENGDRLDVTRRIADLTNALSNSSSEKISRIKRAFEQSIGPVLSKHYYIQGERGGDRFIPLDRSLVTFE